jgi:hypothetical protein
MSFCPSRSCWAAYHPSGCHNNLSTLVTRRIMEFHVHDWRCSSTKLEADFPTWFRMCTFLFWSHGYIVEVSWNPRTRVEPTILIEGKYDLRFDTVRQDRSKGPKTTSHTLKGELERNIVKLWSLDALWLQRESIKHSILLITPRQPP